MRAIGLLPRNFRLAVGALALSVGLSFAVGGQASAAPLSTPLPATQQNQGQEDPIGAVYAAAYNHGVAPYILLGIVRLESGFNPYAVGDYGESVGLIQLHRRGLRNHFYQMGYTDPYSAEQAADYLAAVAAGEFPGVTLRHWTAARLLGYA